MKHKHAVHTMYCIASSWFHQPITTSMVTTSSDVFLPSLSSIRQCLILKQYNSSGSDSTKRFSKLNLNLIWYRLAKRNQAVRELRTRESNPKHAYWFECWFGRRLISLKRRQLKPFYEIEKYCQNCSRTAPELFEDLSISNRIYFTNSICATTALAAHWEVLSIDPDRFLPRLQIQNC